jgi:Domain of unknown function (DUF4407)
MVGDSSSDEPSPDVTSPVAYGRASANGHRPYAASWYGDTWLLEADDARTVDLTDGRRDGRRGHGPEPPDWEAPPDPPDPPEAPALVRRRLRTPAPGVARRMAIFASGADKRLLAYAPIEQNDVAVQGTLVILTALVALISGLAASGFLVTGHFTISPVTVVVGLAWATLIFFFDRALVSGTFNPYHFNRTEVASLRDAPADSVWVHITNGDRSVRHPVLARCREIARVLLVASVRIALAVATSFIAAEMVLFLVFEPEITARASYIDQQNQAQRIAQIQSDYAAQSARRAGQRAQLSGGSDPDSQRLRVQVTATATQLANSRKDLEVLQSALAAERDGVPYTGTLSDGSRVASTGMRGNGEASRSLSQRRDATQRRIDGLTTRLDRTEADLNARIAAVKRTNAAALAALDRQDDLAATQEQAAIRAASGDPSQTRGLLVRQAALNQLVNDRQPDTVAPDPLPRCTNVLCRVRRFLVPPTPMGPIVVAFRVIFFVIEILPIMFKVIASLRRRRPYDAMKAAFEEAAVADAIRLADRQLHEASAEMTTRVRLRRARRSDAVGRHR